MRHTPPRTILTRAWVLLSKPDNESVFLMGQMAKWPRIGLDATTVLANQTEVCGAIECASMISSIAVAQALAQLPGFFKETWRVEDEIVSDNPRERLRDHESCRVRNVAVPSTLDDRIEPDAGKIDDLPAA